MSKIEEGQTITVAAHSPEYLNKFGTGQLKRGFDLKVQIVVDEGGTLAVYGRMIKKNGERSKVRRWVTVVKAAVNPAEVDAELARLYTVLDGAEASIEQLHDMARKVYAEQVLEYRIRYGRRGAEFPAEATREAAMEYVRGLDLEGPLGNYAGSRVGRFLAKVDELSDQASVTRSEIARQEKKYTGWSRFFLVTSSSGHVHSSMTCHTCRPTTAYGWVPQLSGKTEAEAVALLGETLCSVCYPSAPVAWQGGRITKAQAKKLAA